MSSEISEYGIGFLLARGDARVFFCLVVVNERFKADLVCTLCKVVESALNNCQSSVADVGLELSVTTSLTLSTETSSP